jgi:hypothetical protein
LKINFEDLSQALKSLPLYKKLNLEEREVCVSIFLSVFFGAFWKVRGVGIEWEGGEEGPNVSKDPKTPK